MTNWKSNLLIAVAALGLGACGGGSSSGGEAGADSGTSDGGAETRRVEGPLDAVQEPVSEQLFAQLADGTSGTPLEPVVLCADQAITFGALDIGDAVLVALQDGAESGDPQAAIENASMNIQDAGEQFAIDLQNLLAALGGEQCATAGGNGSEGGGGGDGTDNPLAGTPLAPLGDALAPVLGAFPGGGDGGGNGEVANLQELSDFYRALNQALQDGLSQIPPEAMDAPVLGGIFNTLSTTLEDLDGLLFAVSIFDSPGSATEVQNTLNNLLFNVLTQVVPVAFIEEQAGMGGEFTGQIQDAVNQLTEPFSNLQTLFDPLFDDIFADALQPLIDPIGNQLLPAILGPLTDAIAGGDGNGDGLTGTPLDGILAPLTSLLGGNGGGGTTGTPLDALITALTDAFGGAGGLDDPATAIQDILAQLQDAAPA